MLVLLIDRGSSVGLDALDLCVRHIYSWSAGLLRLSTQAERNEKKVVCR